MESSVESSFASIEKRSKKAQEAVRREQKNTEGQQAKSDDRVASSKERAAERERKAAERAAQTETRTAERAARARIREIERVTRAKETADARAAKSAERAAAREQRAVRRTGESFARRTSYRASRFLAPSTSMGTLASRTARDLAQGAGIETSMGSTLGRTIEQQKMAVDLSNMGYQPNAEPGNANRSRVAPDDLVKQTREIAIKYGGDTTDGLTALNEYAAIAGDLNAARGALDDLAQLSKATGTNLSDMAAAAGNVDAQLGDIPDKAKVVAEVMRVIAGQGKLGGVEIRDLSTHMARIAASASNFEGDKAENIKKMGALAQISRGEGGAPSAAEAARSTAGFANTLQKSARIAAFKDQGIEVYNEKNQIRDPFELIKEALSKTKGDPREMNKLFMDVIGKRAIQGLANTFNAEGGGDAGLAAVDKKLDKFVKNATISDKELTESLTRASQTDAAKVARFNAQLEQVGDDLRAKLLPAFEEVEPKLLELARVFGTVSTWVVENPKLAIASAIGLSIARAGIESVFRASVERMIVGKDGSRAAGAGSAVGMASAGMMAAGAGLALGSLTTLAVENLVAKSADLRTQAADSSNSAWDLEKKAQEKMQGGDYKAAEALLLQAKGKREEARDAVAEESEGGFVRTLWETIEMFRGNLEDVDAQKAWERERIESSNAAIEATRDMMREVRNQLASGINVNNLPPADGASGPRAEQ